MWGLETDMQGASMMHYSQMLVEILSTVSRLEGKVDMMCNGKDKEEIETEPTPGVFGIAGGSSGEDISAFMSYDSELFDYSGDPAITFNGGML